MKKSFPSHFSAGHKNLIRRYLLWAYKSARESFERTERKTTQLAVDEYILEYFNSHRCRVPPSFKTYIADKRKDELRLKFAAGGKKPHPDYVYLKNRLAAVEAAIGHFLGERELKHMAGLYEEEFMRRILEALDH